MTEAAKSRRPSSGIWYAAFPAGCAVFAFTVSCWLSDPLFSTLLWPADINQQVVGWLGGSVRQGLAGQLETSLPWLAVCLRGLLAGALLVAAAVFRRKPETQSLSGFLLDLLRPLSLTLLNVLIWWGLWLLGEVGLSWSGQLALNLLPLWMTATLSVFAWILLTSIFNLSGTAQEGAVISGHSDLKARGSLVLLGIAALLWTAVSFGLNAMLYQQLMIPHGDSAMYEEHLWNVWHGKGFRSYLDQGLFLGEHIQVIHLLLLPFHLIWPSHLLLELAESVALASCSLIVYFMTVRSTGSRWAGLWMGLAWLCFFPMHYLDIAIDQKTFRPIVLGLPFLFGLIHFGEKGHLWKAAACLILALSAKEDVALVACPLLAVIAVRHRHHSSGPWKSLLGMSLGTGLYLVLTVFVIIPAFRSGEHVHYARYFGELGNTPGELIRTGLVDPLAVLKQICRVQTVVYVAVFLVPLALLPLKRPWLLSAGMVTFAMLSLLQFSSEGADLPPVPYHHFHAPLLPVIFWAGIQGLATVAAAKVATEKVAAKKGLIESSGKSRRSQRIRAQRLGLLVVCCSLGTAVTGSLSPLGATFWSKESNFGFHRLYASSDPVRVMRAESIDAVVRKIPNSARVASTDYVHTRLTHHDRSYDYSDYLRAVNDYQPGVPADTDWIVLDLGHPYSRIRSVEDVPELQSGRNQWQVRSDLSNEVFLVLQRR